MERSQCWLCAGWCRWLCAGWWCGWCRGWCHGSTGSGILALLRASEHSVLHPNRTWSAETSWKPAVRESRAVFSVRCSSLSAAGPFLPRLVRWGGWICGNERCQEVEGERAAWPLLFLQSHIISLIFFG